MKEHYELEVSLQATAHPEIKSSVLSSLLVRNIRELLFNVVKHSGERQAFINVHVKDRYMLISVKDSGKGCDPIVLQAKREKDMAFGLGDIEERVKFLGGYMDVESSVGNGFRVMLWVPRDVYCPSETGRPISGIPKSNEIIDEKTIHDHPGVASDSFTSVVIVDDHSMMRDGLFELINGQSNIRVVGMAANGKEAIELAIRLKPRVILMDVNMPVMNGIDATTQIHALFPEICIIGITMHKDPDIREAMINAGAYTCLTKFGSTAELINTILAVI
jgi:CheY-like chemotaxis protein